MSLHAVKASPNSLLHLTWIFVRLRTILLLKDNTTIEGLKSKLPVYLVKSEGVSPEINVLQWWDQHDFSPTGLQQ